MPGKGKLALTLILGLAVAAVSCEKTPPPRSDYPAPGELRVVSVDKLAEDTPAENLIENGNFDEWYAGAPCATGFVAPKDERISFVRRRDPRGGAGRHSVDQFWEASDADTPAAERFSTVVKGLKPDTVYRLEVYAASFNKTTASVSVWELTDDGELGGCWPNLIEIEAGESTYKRYSKTFVTNQTNSILIASHANPKTTYKGRVLWLEWYLAEGAGDEKAEPEKTKLPPKFVMTQPGNAAAGVSLSAGEDLVCKGWFLSDEEAKVTYVLGDEETEASYNARPDLENKYQDYALRSGWNVSIPSGALQPENRVVFRLGGVDQIAVNVKVAATSKTAEDAPEEKDAPDKQPDEKKDANPPS